MANLGKLLWAARMKGYYLAVGEATGQTMSGEPPPLTARDLAYDTQRGQLVAEGRSRDGRVHITVRGMRDWSVRIADGTTDVLDADEFAVRVAEAGRELVRHQMSSIWALKERIYEQQEPR